MAKELLAGKKVKNPRTGLVRTITKVGPKNVSYSVKRGKVSFKGQCSVQSMRRWVAGKDV